MGPVSRSGVLRDLREAWDTIARVTGNFVLLGLLLYALAQLVWP